MKIPERRYVLWVKRDDAGDIADPALRERAGVEDPNVEVHTRTLGRWGNAEIPAGSQDESGTVFPEPLNVGPNELPPEGRVYLIWPGTT